MAETEMMGGLILALAALISLFLTVGKPIINLNTTMVELTLTVKQLKEDYEKLSRQSKEDLKDLACSNAESHRRIHEKIDDHESRLQELENHE